MKTLLMIAFRNLIRQKRRNTLLGIAIGFGLSILIIGSSFSSGISKIILENFMAMIAGHMEISVKQKTSYKADVIHDKAGMVEKIKTTLPEFDEIREAVVVWGRVVGNGKGESMVIAGIHKKGFDSKKYNFTVVGGSMDDFLNDPDACMIYEGKAKALNLALGDFVNTRLTTIKGQAEAIKSRVAVILKAESFFNDLTVFVDMGTLKEKMGLLPHETVKLQVMFKNPKKAKEYADLFHKSAYPKTAAISFSLKGKNILASAYNELKISYLRNNTNHEAERSIKEFNIKVAENEIAMPQRMMSSLGVKAGQSVTLSMTTKYEGVKNFNFKVVPLKVDLYQNEFALLNFERFVDIYYDNPVENFSPSQAATIAGIDQLDETLVKNWILLRRSTTTQDILVKYSELSQKKWKGQNIDVRTMYETGQQFLMMEGAFNALVYLAAIVIFFIITIGVINTLQMTIRERTKEIGTLRAIGMKKNEVLMSFVYETLMLTLIASVVSYFFSLFLMYLISLIDFGTTSQASMFLEKGHMYFPNNIAKALLFVFFITLVTTMGAFIPAWKASKLRPSEALRHS